jgi:hypothetical protein
MYAHITYIDTHVCDKDINIIYSDIFLNLKFILLFLKEIKTFSCILKFIANPRYYAYCAQW